MVRTRVASSCVSSVGYDDEANSLEVELANGRVYLYYLVPREVYEGLLAAESAGRYFNAVVRPSYPSRRLCEEQS